MRPQVGPPQEITTTNDSLRSWRCFVRNADIISSSSPLLFSTMEHIASFRDGRRLSILAERTHLLCATIAKEGKKQEIATLQKSL